MGQDRVKMEKRRSSKSNRGLFSSHVHYSSVNDIWERRGEGGYGYVTEMVCVIVLPSRKESRSLFPVRYIYLGYAHDK